jgi:hypothetical protein
MNSDQGLTIGPDPSELLPDSIHPCLAKGDTGRLALDPTFMGVRCRAHPIVRLFEFTGEELHISFSMRAVARPFHVDHAIIKLAELRRHEESPLEGDIVCSQVTPSEPDRLNCGQNIE